jgi:short-subunit dehydrogenase
VATDVFRQQAKEGVKGGDIGIVASLSSHGPVPGLSLYAATKAAALSLATSLSVELKKDKIRVHAVCPDGVDTKMVADMRQDGEARELVGSGTFLQPQQVAHALVEMFGSRRVYRTLPASRGVMMPPRVPTRISFLDVSPLWCTYLAKQRAPLPHCSTSPPSALKIR